MTTVRGPGTESPALRRETRQPSVRSPLYTFGLPVGVWLVGALVYFRQVWSSGFDHLSGNDGDTRLVAYICEHWFRVLHGQASWRNPSFFYPVKGLLGWSDSFFLFQPLYAPLRELGCGPMLALQLTVILLSGIGFVTFFFLARGLFGGGDAVALAGALVFTFANNLYLHVASSQLSGLYLLPPVVLLGRASVRRISTSPGRAAVLGAAAGLLYGLLFFTTWYISLFSLLAAAIGTVWALVLRWTTVTAAVRALRSPAGPGRAARGYTRPAAATLAGFVAGIVPFALTYLPVRSSIGGVSESAVLNFSQSVTSVFNVSPGNLVWGSAVSHLQKATSSSYEPDFAVTPFLLLAMIAGAVWVAWRLRRRASIDTSRSWAALVLTLTSLTLWVTPVRFTGRAMPWLLLRVLPGFDAIRAVDRIQVVTGAVAITALVATAAEARDAARSWTGASRRSMGLAHAALAGVLVLVVLEQVNTAGVTFIDRAAQDRLVSSVPAPPAACRYFFVTDRANPSLPFFESQVDAMLISQKVGLPTLNGYTGYSPKDWSLDPIGNPLYLTEVHSWEAIRSTGPGGCGLDLGTMAWTPDPAGG